jgi:hypothetical protein
LDRGYYDSGNEKLAYDAGVKNVCIPKVGKKSKVRAQFEDTRFSVISPRPLDASSDFWFTDSVFVEKTLRLGGYEIMYIEYNIL